MKSSTTRKLISTIKSSKPFIDSVTTPMFIVDDNLIVHYINKKALQQLGYEEEEVVGKMKCFDLYNSGFSTADDCTLKKSMADQREVVGQTVLRKKNGAVLPVKSTSNAIYDKKGRVIGGCETLSDISVIDEGFMNNMSDAAFRTDENLIIQNINDAALTTLGYNRDEVVGKMSCADLCKTPVCNTERCTIKNCIKNKTMLVAETTATRRNGDIIPVRASCGYLVDGEGNPSGGFEIITNNSEVVSMIKKMEMISNGDLTVEIDERTKNRDDAVGKLATAMGGTISKLTNTISDIIVSSQNLVQAVEQISIGNQDLAQRTTEQASSLEEIAATIEEASAAINQIADSAQVANKQSEEAYLQAGEGGDTVIEAVTAINEINETSQKINDIIGVINDIAFQTNLLALNASVEAARAGEQGRGFAVVAGEVRNLAQRAAKASKEIEDLIKTSIKKIEKGTNLSNKSGESLKTIIKVVKNVSAMVAEIASGSAEQKAGMDQITMAVTEIDTMTQKNSAMVEETASASEEMASQAQELLNMMGQFKIKQFNGHRNDYKAPVVAEETYSGNRENSQSYADGDLEGILLDDGFKKI